MHRFYVLPQNISNNTVVFAPEQGRQIKNVLRLRAGDTVAAFDGSGQEFCVSLHFNGSQTTGNIISTCYPKTEPPVKITLVQGLPKGEKVEFILQKCTEIGISAFIFVESVRSVAQIPQERLKGRMERWRAIAKEAAEQSGRVCLPTVNGVSRFANALENVSGAGLIAWEEERHRTLPDALERINPAGEVTLFIGPEGGWTPDEVSQAEAAGISSVSLGSRILRTETAAIVASALAIYGR
ncbi:MAG TPA: 16S rRNA (uracil(1498)-N(3))-methyltransferase [Armatimonadetes bacterium]|jgi:16S rRNA (uracil1498-N3)-methyltransferase|nr:16S rRNA (uracil(1498)-N(3))-methyltransferase [Armatimonadota bacterium]